MIWKFCCLMTYRSLSPQCLLNIFTELFRWVAWHPIERGFSPLLFQISFLFLLYQYVKDLKCKIQIISFRNIIFSKYYLKITILIQNLISIFQTFVRKISKNFYINLLDHRGSNPERKDQNLACYHYTMIQLK